MLWGWVGLRQVRKIRSARAGRGETLQRHRPHSKDDIWVKKYWKDMDLAKEKKTEDTARANALRWAVNGMFKEEQGSRWDWRKVKGEKQQEVRSDGNREPDHVGLCRSLWGLWNLLWMKQGEPARLWETEMTQSERITRPTVLRKGVREGKG